MTTSTKHQAAANNLAATRQTAILDTRQLLEFIKPISERIYWSVVAKDPRFPKPIMGGDGRKALHSRERVESYLVEVGRTGFMSPSGEII